MIKELINIANELDGRGLVKEADYLDYIVKMANVSNTWIKRTFDVSPEGKAAADALSQYNKIFTERGKMLIKSLKHVADSLDLTSLETDVDARDESYEERKEREEAEPQRKGLLSGMSRSIGESGFGAVMDVTRLEIEKLFGNTTEKLEDKHRQRVVAKAFKSMGSRFKTWEKMLMWGMHFVVAGKALTIEDVEDIERTKKGLNNAIVITKEISSNFPDDSTDMEDATDGGRFSSDDIKVAALLLNKSASATLAAINAWTATAAAQASDVLAE